MDHIDETVRYLAACSPETRDALISVAMSPLVNTAEKGDDLSVAARAVATIADHPLDVASGLLALNHKPKRGRPRGSKSKSSGGKE